MSKKKKNVGSSTVKENKIETIMENDVVVETENAKKNDEIDTVDIIDEKRAEVTFLDDSESIIAISEDSKETGDSDKDDENETPEKTKLQDDEDEGFLDEDEDEGFLDDDDDENKGFLDEDEDEGFLDEDEDEGFLDDDENEAGTKEAEENQQESENTDGNAVINSESAIMEEESDESEKKKHKFLKPLLITLGSITGLVLLVYLIGVIFFISHFYYNTQINNTNFSMQTAEKVEKYFESQVGGYALTLLENDGSTETITGSDISLVYKSNGQVADILKKQNPFLWPRAFWASDSLDATISVDYDTNALTEVMNGLSCMKAENQAPPSNAYPAFNQASQKYEIVPEVYGTQIDKDSFVKAIKTYLSGFKAELPMQDNSCYAEPKFHEDSLEVIAANDKLNNYIKGTVTYTIPENTEVVDAAKISSWLTLGENMEVNLNTDAVTQYVTELDAKYSTLGGTRTITTPTGKVAEVAGGTYGWSIDEAGELQTLLTNIQSGAPTTREPLYAQTAASRGANDWGTTYVEVDLSDQHMWYVVNGAVAFESAVVTGKPSNGHSTPAGVFTILERMRNKVLRGTKKPDGTYEYETQVAYWMRVTWSGVGFHDATWQPSFGGSRYLTNGSHGCINMPYSGAAGLYDIIQVGVPVVMHY